MKNLLKITTLSIIILSTISNAGIAFAQNGYGGSGSSGTRVTNRPITPLPLVLGAATSAVVANRCSGMYLNDYLRKGNVNNVDQVKKLQSILNEQGFPVPITGFFGDITERAVRSFQAKYPVDILAPWKEVSPTGYVFKTTRAKINNLVCPGSEAIPVV